jgi:hypothetical protein
VDAGGAVAAGESVASGGAVDTSQLSQMLYAWKYYCSHIIIY